MPGVDPDRWQALSPHLDRALEMSDEEREAWLASLRAEDATLADELRSLLGSRGLLASESFLENPPLELPKASALEGQSIGPYRLISELGHGGMGTVWLAERNDGRFERKVAVKFLNISLVGKGGEERFRREGHILGRLAHPHIAELIDAGVTQSGQPYLILEHVSGDHIDRYCDDRRLDVTSRIRLFLDVLEAVEHAHTNLVVHRDLKPSNVLVRNDGEAKLLDFGIAKLLEIDETAYRTQLTVEAGRALTPDYAAPEQLTGQPISPSTDIYSLGVLLYVLLTGRHPTASDTHAPVDLIKAVLETEPLRPSEAVLHKKGEIAVASTNAARRNTIPEKLSHRLRGDLDTIVTKSIKKDPQERYATVRDLANDLRCYLDSKPISARPDSFTYRTGKYLRRHCGRIATAMAIVLMLGIGFGASRLYFPKVKALPQIQQRRLTANPKNLPVQNAKVSPDGTYLGYVDQDGFHVQLVETSTPYRISLPPELMNGKTQKIIGNWYPNSRQFLAAVMEAEKPASLWAISIDGTGAQKIASIDDMWNSPAVSPDGSRIAYTRVRTQSGARELWLMGPRGESPHLIKVADPQSSFYDLAWAPDGKRLAYTYYSHRSDVREFSVQSCDVNGQNVTTLLHERRLEGYSWPERNRVVYGRSTDPGGTDSDNLLEVRVDDNGVPIGKPQPLTNWSGFAAWGYSSTRDGKHMAFLRGTAHNNLDIVDVVGNIAHPASARPFNADDNFNIPLAWTPDSSEIIFSSKRSNHRLVYRRKIDQKTPAQLVTDLADMNFYFARPTPDGSALLLEGSPSTNPLINSIYRVDLSSGKSRLLFSISEFVLFWCTNAEANFCVLGQMNTADNQLIITKVDPVSGNRTEAARIPLEPGTSAGIGDDYSWQLAPDGRYIAIARRHTRTVQLVPLRDGPPKSFSLEPQNDLLDLSWASDSRGIYFSAMRPDGVAIVYSDLNGKTRDILANQQAYWMGTIPSPDGKKIVFWTDMHEANVWMIDDF